MPGLLMGPDIPKSNIGTVYKTVINRLHFQIKTFTLIFFLASVLASTLPE
jgi:hypothetical protein